MKQHEDYNMAEIMRSRPHLFILGAGATKATIPNGDKYGRQSPVMENFMQEIGIDGMLNGVKLKTKSNNIEAIYSELASKPEYADVVRQIEDGIVNHYRQMCKKRTISTQLNWSYPFTYNIMQSVCKPDIESLF